jgi:RNA polymerase sigma factor (TIGR02999 family)
VSEPASVTQILLGMASEQIPAEEGLALIYPAVSQELRRLAGALMRRQPAGHTLSATALVHEAYLRLVDQRIARSHCRAQFFSIASKAMRSILVDHARRRAARKRGGGWRRVGLETDPPAPGGFDVEVLDLHRALEALETRDRRLANVVEMRVFGGLTVQETAEALGVAARTVDNDWKVARAWLSDRMAQGGST